MLDRSDFTVGWICAVGKERVAAQLFLDEEYDPPEDLPVNDKNVYVLGRVGEHGAVIAGLQPEQASASALIRDMVRSFPGLRIGLMVGTGSVAPSKSHEVRLGDIVVSSSTDGNGGLVQYDYDKTMDKGSLAVIGYLDQPPSIMSTAISALRDRHRAKGNRIQESVEGVLQKQPGLQVTYQQPYVSADRPFSSNFDHKEPDEAAASVSCSIKIDLSVRKDQPKHGDCSAIHYGLIASARQPITDASLRNALATENGILCFDTDAAGVMANFPCIVVRGICDDTDAHGNERWRGYAAMAAAAYARALLLIGVSQWAIKAEKSLRNILLGDPDHGDEDIFFAYESQQEKLMIETFEAPVISNVHNEVKQSRLEGSGTWLLNDSKYRAWKAKPGSFLWLTGAPGCGKTVLSSIVVDDVRSTCQRKCLAYFYFNSSDPLRRTLSSLLRSLIRQFYTLHDESRECVLALLRPSSSRYLSYEQLYNCLVEIINRSKQVWIVLDALDECIDRDEDQSNGEGVSRFIKRLLQDTRSHVHLLVTSQMNRDSRDFSLGLTPAECMISLDNGQIRQDIESYIDYQLRPGGRFNRWQKRSDVILNIKRTLMDCFEGVFRWTAYQLDNLVKCFDPKSLGEALSQLPKNLDETYQRILNDIPEIHKAKVITIFRLLAFSERPLTVDELADAIATDTKREPHFEQAARLPRPADVVHYCPGLLRLTHERQKQKRSSVKQSPIADVATIRFADSSVKECLTSERLDPEMQRQMDESTSRASLASICVSYLSQIDNKMSKSEIEEAFPFASYCTRYWWKHAASRGPSAIADGPILDFMQNNEALYQNLLRMFEPHFRDCYLKRSVRMIVPSGLYWASLYGLVTEAEVLVSRGVDVNVLGGEYYHPLIAAATRGHKSIVELLLANGADVHVRGREKQTALHSACQAGHTEIVQLLLDAHGDANASDREYTGVLSYACKANHLDLVQLLLDRGAWIDDPTGNLYSALHQACSEGHEDLVQFLLSKGADLNGLGPRSRTPLSAAAEKGYTTIVTILLSYGASRVPQLNEEDSPLHLASEKGRNDVVKVLLDAGCCPSDSNANVRESSLCVALANDHMEVVRMLLEAGADANCKNDRGHTALRTACEKNREDVVQLLLDCGADINAKDGFMSSTSALSVAIHEGFDTITQTLLDRGALVNTPDPASVGGAALWAACTRGKADLVRILCERGADVNYSDRTGTVLQSSISRKHAEIVRILLEYGADVNLIPKSAGYSDREEVSRSPLLRAYEQQDWPLMKMLFHHGADLHAPASDYKEDNSVLENVCIQKKSHQLSFLKKLFDLGFNLSSGLLAACYYGRTTLTQSLLEMGVDTNVSNKKFENLLVAAARAGSTDIVQMLLDKGAPVDVSSSICGSAIFQAASRGHDKIVRLLLVRGADPNLDFECDIYNRGFYEWSLRHGTALQAACYKGYEDTVRSLIAGGARVNATGGEHGSALAAASSEGHKGVVQLLLDLGVRVNTVSGKRGSALTQACGRRHKEVIQLLLAKGADPNAASEKSKSALVRALECRNSELVQVLLDNLAENAPPDIGALAEAIWQEDDDLIQTFLDRTGDLTGQRGAHPLHMAVQAGNDKIFQELIRRGADVNAREDGILTGLVTAARDSLEGMIQPLLDQGADLNAQFDTITTPADFPAYNNYANALHAAVQNGHVGTTQILLHKGADPFVRAGKHKDLLQTALYGYTEALQSWEYSRAWHEGYYGYLDEFDKPRPDERFDPLMLILLDQRIDAAWSPEEYDNFLLQSASKGLEKTVSILIERGANVNASDEAHGSALQAALTGQHSKIIWILMDNGAQVLDWDCPYGEDQKTLLHHAAEGGHKDKVRRCIAAQVNLDITDKSGRTALHYAAMNGHHEIISMLLEKGAEQSTRIRDSRGGTPLALARGAQIWDEEPSSFPLCVQALTQSQREDRDYVYV